MKSNPLLFAGTAAHAQVNSGSDGHDGAFNPTSNTAIDMADHPMAFTTTT